MSEYVNLMKVWGNPELLGEDRNPNLAFLNYRPDVWDLKGRDASLGTKQMDLHIRRPNVGFHAWVQDEMIYMIPEKPLENVQFFRNEDGWQNVREVGERIAKAFGCVRLKAKGILFTQSIYNSMPEELKPFVEGHCWVFKDPPAQIKENFDMLFCRNGHMENMAEYYANDGMCYSAKEFMPLIVLPSNIMVKVGSETRHGKTVDASLRLKLPDNRKET